MCLIDLLGICIATENLDVVICQFFDESMLFAFGQLVGLDDKLFCEFYSLAGLSHKLLLFPILVDNESQVFFFFIKIKEWSNLEAFCLRISLIENLTQVALRAYSAIIIIE